MKIGDKIICINNDDGYGKQWSNLTLDKEYIILDIVFQNYKLYIKDNFGEGQWFYCDRFLTLNKYRKLKLNKLNIISEC